MQQLATWQLNATQALAEPGEARASPLQTKQDRRRIKELERELLRKDRALAETARRRYRLAHPAALEGQRRPRSGRWQAA
jgi:cell division protein FtsB